MNSPTAARLAELLKEAKEAPEGVAVRVSGPELLWLLEARIQLRTALVKLAGQMDSAICRGAPVPVDHACAECIPWGTILITGFRCGRHATPSALRSGEPS
jgi:hypothetical protein